MGSHPAHSPENQLLISICTKALFRLLPPNPTSKHVPGNCPHWGHCQVPGNMYCVLCTSRGKLFCLLPFQLQVMCCEPPSCGFCGRHACPYLHLYLDAERASSLRRGRISSLCFLVCFCFFAVGYSATWEASFVWSWAGMLLNFTVILSILVNDAPSKQACGSSSTQRFYKDDGALFCEQVEACIRLSAGSLEHGLGFSPHSPPGRTFGSE